MANERKRLLSNNAWTVIWVIVTLLMFLVYPGTTSFWAGYFPVSVFKTFGMMVVIFICAFFFVKDSLNTKSE